MSVSANTVCQVKGRFRHCREQAVAVCVYCGHAFCARHGVRLEDAMEVCDRRFCRAKRDDLEKHVFYKQRVAHSNAQGLCGMEKCQNPGRQPCVRCRGMFCGKHVHARDDTYMVNGVSTRRMASLCAHCSGRRRIWMRT